MRQTSRLSVFLILTLAAAACQDAADPISPAPEISASVGGGQGSAQAPDLETLDRAIPGFGGFFLDAQGAPTLFLTDVRGRGPAEQALGGYLRASGLDPSALRVQQAQYSYGQLKRWFEASAEALGLPGAVYADLQEATNRVEFGVEHPAAGAAVQALTRQLGIPDGAVTIKRTEPIVQVATLRDNVDPIVAGLQINFPGFLCSLGFNALKNGQNSFVTASHCTNTQGGVEGTPYWQPLESVDPVQIGTEVADPTYRRNIPGCPRGRKCRWSDAARVAYASGISSTLGRVAKTNLNSISITGEYRITADDLRDHFTAGEAIQKVGRTTGRTTGTVSNTCVNTGVSGTNIVQLCQTFVSSSSVIVGGGDSGSDVIRITNAVNDEVALAGILWGGNGSGTLFVFSPLKNVMRSDELGTLTTH